MRIRSLSVLCPLLLVPWIGLVGGCSPDGRLAAVPTSPFSTGDVGTTLPNDPVDGSVIVDDTDAPDTDVAVDTDTTPTEVTLTSVAAGRDFTCATWSDGTLSCWGANDVGQSRAPAGSYQTVVAGSSHACALNAAGRVVCWGDATLGRLQAPAGVFTGLAAGSESSCAWSSTTVSCWGNGLTAPTSVPGVAKIVVGSAFGCALNGDGDLVCFGAGAAVRDAPDTATDIAAGLYHVCALTQTGAVTCWGADNLQQVGDAPAGAGYASIAAGGNTSCAVRAGRATCWGFSESNHADVPTDADLHDVSVGSSHVCAGKGDAGDVVCWGSDDSFEATPPIVDAVAVTVGMGGHGCALHTDGSLTCFGLDAGGQATPPDGPWSEVAAGWFHTCGLRDSGGVACWGVDTRGQATAPSTGTWSSVAPGRLFSCAAMAATGAVTCWGDLSPRTPPPASPGGLIAGNGHVCGLSSDAGGTMTCAASPGTSNAFPAAPVDAVTAVAAGNGNTCWIAGGQLGCAGADVGGETSPPAGNYRDVALGMSHGCAIASAGGGLHCWGDDTEGAASPPTGSYTDVAAGDGVTCAVRVDGRVRCWGNKAL
ncbi:MAG: hypothetical protein H6733_14045 [Alphaproteobacteria bacterium]|nr:hypothetical protein [Alphaproteobacteria bacterium]